MVRMCLPIVLGVCGASIGVSAASGQDQPEPVPVERPKYSFLRFNEDWSVLKDAPREELTDFWDPIKYVPLNDDGSIWASFGGSTRLRLESWWNFGFGTEPPDSDDTFLLWRALVHGDFHFGENVRAFVQGKSALATDRDLAGGRRPLDIDVLDLEAAFVDLKLSFDEDVSLVFRPGRQPLAFGKQRLVSPLGWSNTLRRWDGVSGILEWGRWDLTGFWAQFVPVKKYEFNESDSDVQLFGVYATGPLAETGIGMDLYFLGYDNDNVVTINSTAGTQERYTVGGRLFGKIADTALDYDFEGAYQFGEVGSGDVDAFMIGSQLGYRAADLWSVPRFFVGFDYGSGDRSPGGDVETFNQLFPLGHAYLGYIDAIGRQNIIDFNLGLTCSPFPKATLGLTGHFFWRADTSDALYNAGGAPVRAGSLGSSSEVGQEIDLTLKYNFDRHLVGLLGYSHFFAGDFIEESGSSDDIDFLYVQLEYTF
ncbi:MAG: alginate export family protein [Planctomycetota bacterium]